MEKIGGLKVKPMKQNNIWQLIHKDDVYYQIVYIFYTKIALPS